MSTTWNYNYAQIARDSGFKFHRCNDGSLDWKLIGSLDIDKVIKEQNFEKIENIVTHLSEAPLAEILLNSQILDSGFIKYFILSQLSIQYLLFCMKFLDESINQLKNTLEDAQQKNNEYKSMLDEQNQQLLQLHKKIHNLENLNQIIYPCPECPKNFISNEMLNIHIARRHPNIVSAGGVGGNQHHGSGDGGEQQLKRVSISTVASAENDHNLINTIKLELEVKHLKERLNSAEKEMRENRYHNHQCNHQLMYEQQRRNSKHDNSVNSQRTSSPREIKDNLEKITNDCETQTDDIQTMNGGDGCDSGRSFTTNEIGIQSNLDDIKEVDEKFNEEQNHEFSIDNNNNNVILNEIKEKILQFENFCTAIMKENEKHADEQNKNKNQESESEINEKLNTILSTIENFIMKQQNSKDTSDDHDHENLNDYHQQQQQLILDNIKLIQQTVRNDIMQLFENNYELKMNETLQKFENQLIISLESIEEKFSLPRRLNEKINQNSPIMKSEESSESETSSTQTTEDDQETKSNSTFVYSMYDQKEMDEIEGNGRIEVKKINALHPKRQKEINSKEIINKNTSKITKKDSIKLMNNRLKELGINPNLNFLKHSSKEQLHEQLIEIHRNLKMKNPNFFVTRNKLKRLVDKMTTERFHNLISKSKVQIPSPTQCDDDEEAAPTIINVVEEFNDMESHLKRVLESPIRKPSQVKYFDVSGKTDNPKVQEIDVEEVSPVHNDDSATKEQQDITKVPVPAPRRNVTFEVTTNEKPLPIDVNVVMKTKEARFESDTSSTISSP